ncbi:hypothetical protein DM02DRAFT_678710 [Periconia macrospinosa]|uniref:Uncharacterized protein n=1 Tax=Periconia macrospinosa TaxID=97972 RepID=A0A2V1CX74_9PLEO|nr:hypothetical protein DM02DRAFT_678710 [Periconia macrospinosa]
MLSPNTAPRGRSIWSQVDRKTFENGLDNLHNAKFITEPQTLREEDWPKPRKFEVLPFAIEKQLSDDIAFVSAYDYGVRYVTCAAIEAGEREGLLIRLAANEGVCVLVVGAWTRLISTLERCAKKALSREQCVEDALDIVITLNRNRILGRLASRHFQRSQHENGPARNALPERLKTYLRSSKRQSTETKKLTREVDNLHTAFLDMENSRANTGTIRRVVIDAFRLTVDGISLPVRLEKAGFSPSTIDTREVREVNKIANYLRVCHSPVHLSDSLTVISYNIFQNQARAYRNVRAIRLPRKQ